MAIIILAFLVLVFTIWLLLVDWKEFYDGGYVTLTYNQFTTFYSINTWKWTCNNKHCYFDNNGRMFYIRFKTPFDYLRYRIFLKCKKKNFWKKRDLEITSDFLEIMRQDVQKQADKANKELKQAVQNSKEVVERITWG